MSSQSLCSHRLWPHCLLLASPTNPVPLAVSATALSSTGITRRLLSHITGRRLSAMSNTTGHTGRLQVIMTNTTRLTALPYTGHLPERVERSVSG